MRKIENSSSINARLEVVLNKFKSRMSAFPPGICPLALYRSILQISINQSCGKCVPCRDGLVKADKLLSEILEGTGTKETFEELERLAVMISKTADCAVGVVAANTVLDSIKEFPDEYKSHIEEKCCVEDVGQTIPCSTLCPAHVDVPAYIALIKEKEYEAAVNIIRNKNPFPTACAFVCEHPCEKKCRRTIIDQPINIRGLKRYAVDKARANQIKCPTPNVKTGKKIAVVGSGPAGLTAAWFLALMGHRVDVFEEHEKPGGMLRYGIPEYRLPKERLDEDIKAILSRGDIELHCNTKVGRDISFEKIREYDAVFLGLGAQKGRRMPMENADAKNVIPAADFLQNLAAGKPMDLKGKKVALIGGGNVAMDAARTAVRLGAESVHVFTRKRDDITALSEELEGAMQEGVRFRTLLSFLHIETDKETNELTAVWLQPEIVGEYDEYGFVTTEHSSAYPYRFKCDVLILAVGQESDVKDFEKEGVVTNKNRIVTNEYCQLEAMPNVFSGGDCVTGPSTAINAIATGRIAAYNIDEFLGYHHKVSLEEKAPAALPNKCKPCGRTEIEETDPFERKNNFEPVEISMNDEEAEKEASRCLRCDHFGCGTMEGGRK
ncbi:MAG: glutamate synthase [Lachnospiraceae bacterium]|nr:glutamate synthase [Lachnospiraceae bacterium]